MMWLVVGGHAYTSLSLDRDSLPADEGPSKIGRALKRAQKPEANQRQRIKVGAGGRPQ